MATERKATGGRRRRWLKRGAVVVGVPLTLLVRVYLWYGVKVWIGVPRLSRDYAAEMRAAAEAIPEEQRAWPLLREAAMGIEQAPQVREPHPEIDENWLDLTRVEPRHLNWPRLVEYVECHEEQLELIRRAAERPFLGYTDYGRFDDEFYAAYFGRQPEQVTRERATYLERLPQRWRRSAVVEWNLYSGGLDFVVSSGFWRAHYLLLADIRVAKWQRDAARISADVRAYCRLAWLSRECPESGGIARAWHRDFVDLVGAALDELLQHFTDSELRIIQEALSLDDPREIIADALLGHRRYLRIHLDSVYSEGPITGGAVQPRVMWSHWWTDWAKKGWERSNTTDLQLSWVGQPLIAAAFPSKREAERRMEEGLRVVEANESLPFWARSKIRLPAWRHEESRQVAPGVFRNNERPAPIEYAWRQGRFFPNEFIGSMSGYIDQRGAARDGVVVGIALERFRRARGDYPYTLDELVPEFLESVPVDIYDGMPLRFTMAGPESPVVYSVGTNRKDDGGMLVRWLPYHDDDHDRNNTAAQLLTLDELAEKRAEDPDQFDERYRGDWILWPVIVPQGRR